MLVLLSLAVVGLSARPTSASVRDELDKLGSHTSRYILSSVSAGYSDHFDHERTDSLAIVRLPLLAYRKSRLDVSSVFGSRFKEFNTIGTLFFGDLVVNPVLISNTEFNKTGFSLYFTYKLR